MQRDISVGPVRTNVSCAANYDRAPHEVPQTFVNGSALYSPLCCGYKGLNAVPQAVSVSTCQRIIHHTSCGTDILASVAQVRIVLEVTAL